MRVKLCLTTRSFALTLVTLFSYNWETKVSKARLCFARFFYLVFSSIHPFGVLLEADSLHMDLHGVENLELSAIQTLTGFFVTHASILTPDTSRTLSPPLPRRTGRSATPVCTKRSFVMTSRRFGRLLYLVTFISTRVLYQWAVTLSLANDCF